MFPGDFVLVHQAAVFVDGELVTENVIDLFDVFGAQLVLVFTFGVFPVGVNEQYFIALMVGLALIDHQHAGRDAGDVEQTGRQADDGFDAVVVDQQFADELFLATAEQHAVGHDGGHVAVRLEAGDHVLHEHQVGFLAGFRAELAEPAGELHAGAAVVLRERRVG